ncbi:hypothetical protein GCM10007416_35370 [Kroppenstedtia guangzhouensis]|uniref:Uncharacterized protein n=2 Tax=Kroppenstedtia guangzhouensis TaxID=1274356 RepID=A0ABQ1H6M6_9BACL|nr:hypothetical protein GCM10007416_35370 [Kroppenstedtia guangzhouensis]
MMKQGEGHGKDMKQEDQASTGSAEELTRGVRIIRWVFVCFATIFTVCITIQIFFAGLAVFVSPTDWMRHMMFAHWFSALPLIMLILSFVGRLPRKIRLQSLGVFGLMYAVYFTANITAISPLAAAVHPVIGVWLFCMSITILTQTARLAFNNPD